MTSPTPQQLRVRMNQLRRLQQYGPTYGAILAKEIFEEIFQGDHILDLAEELMLEVEDLDPDELKDHEHLTKVEEFYVKILQDQVMTQLHHLIRENRKESS